MLYHYDKQQASHQLIAGIDEAGRGPLAGPVCACAVILDLDREIDGINDSKKLTAKKREELYQRIIVEAKSYSIAFATVEEIEEINILNATLLAMRRAVEGLSVAPELVLVDGNASPKLTAQTRLVVKGDATSASIAAASILAKVARDSYITEVGEQFPEYQFHRHKGYGTKLHYEMLDKFGPCPIHRPSFLRKWEARRNGD